MTQSRRELSGGVVVVRRGPGGKRVLVLHHRDFDEWRLPKGKLEAGESAAEAAARELEEEAGLAEGWLRFLPGFGERIDYFYTMGGEKMHKEVTYFLAECLLPADGEVKLSGEHTDYAWLSRDNAMKTLTYGNDRKVLGRAEKFLEEFLNKK